MITKFCNGCEKDLPLDNFGKKGDRLNSRCKSCISKYYKNLYHSNPDRKKKHQQMVYQRREELLLKNREIVWKYLSEHPCECGESDPIVLSFDHDEPSLKEDNIANMYRKTSSKLLKEIEKCTVRCLNCHVKRTTKQFNWWKLDFLPGQPPVYPLADNE